MSPTFRRWTHLLLILVLCLVSFAVVPPPVQAQEPDYIVDNTTDNDTSAGGTFCDQFTADDCSLRQAIELANARTDSAAILITFSPIINGQIIEIDDPTSPLPPITRDNIEIRGSTNFGIPLNTINGTGKSVGFHLDSDNNTISGLSIYGFSDFGTAPYFGAAIFISGSNNKIVGNFVGITPEGTQPAASLRNFSGITIAGGTGNTIGGATPSFGSANYISGNSQNGVLLNNTSQNFVQGNLIGVVRASLTTTDVLGNGQYGIQVFSSGTNNFSTENTIGSPSNQSNPNAANIIAGNGRAGIRLAGTNTLTNTVRGNFIGTDNFGRATPTNPATPDANYRNLGDGVLIEAGAKNNTISGSASAPMVISNNNYYGVVISGAGTTGNQITGAYIGTGTLGTEVNTDEEKIGNKRGGVRIETGASNNTISGTSSVRTLIVNSLGDGVNYPGHGVTITGVNTQNNRISGVHIGAVPNPAVTNGTVQLPNAGDGILLQNARLTQITQGNLISGNTGYGIRATNALSTTITGNTLGLDVVGTANAPNTAGGIFLWGADNTLIGGVGSAVRNVISGNGGSGIVISDTTTFSTTIVGNIIGLRKNATGSFVVAAPNGGDGIVATGADTLRIGASAVTQGNQIMANAGDGIRISNVLSTTIQSNRIGWLTTGTSTIPTAGFGNAGDGLSVTSSLTVSVVSNLLFQNGGAGMTFDVVTRTAVLSNTVTGTTVSGAGIAMTDALTSTIQANAVTKHGGPGISLTDAFTATIRTNQVIDNGGNGIEVIGTADVPVAPFNFLIDDNDIYTNTIGILVSGEGDPVKGPQRVEITNNSISRNRTAGIDLDPTFTRGFLLEDQLNPNHDIDPPIINPIELGLPLHLRMGISNSGLLSGYVITETDGLPPFAPAACVTCTVQIFKPDPQLTTPDAQGFVSAAPDVTPDETGFFEVQLTGVGTDGLPEQVLLTATDFAGNTSEYGLFTISRDVEIEPDRTEPVQVLPSQVFSYTHTVTNLGSVNDSFRLTASSNRSWQYSIAPSGVFDLRAGESRPVTVTVTVPRGSDPKAAAGLAHTLTVTVTSTTDQTVADKAVDTTTVAGKRQITVSPLTSQGLTQAGQEVEFAHTIRNEGNLTATVTLTLSSTQPSWPTTLNKTSYTLGPGGSDQILLGVTPPSQVLAGVKSVTTIQVNVTEDATQNKTITDTTTIILEPLALLEPDRTGFAAAGETIQFRHTATNRSNGEATFKIEGVSSLGSTIRFVSDTPGITLLDGNTFTVGIEPGSDFFNFYAEITVPDRVRRGQEDTVTIFLTDEDGNRIGGASVQDTISITEGFFPLFLPYLPE